MILRPLVLDGTTSRPVQPGDVIGLGEAIPATIATTNITVTGTQLMNTFVNRSPGAAATDTIDTAANIIAAISGGLGTTGVQNGLTWRTNWLVTTAFAATLTAQANSGVTVTLGVVNASSVKEFLVTVTNGTPAQSFSVNTTNATAIITGLSYAQTSLLSPGMVVTNVAAGQQGNTIIGVQPGVGVTMSGNSNATTTITLNFSPTITIQGIGQRLV